MDGVNWFDGAVMAWVQENFHNAFTDAIFPVITYLGEFGAVWLVLAAVLLCGKRTRLWGAGVLAALVLGVALGEGLLKYLVQRPRPFAVFPDASLLIPPPSGYSFPSGHACSSFAASTVLLRYSKKLGVPALILAVLIAFSRVFLFVHWPTDVLCGAALGTALGLFAPWAVEKAREKWAQRKM